MRLPRRVFEVPLTGQAKGRIERVTLHFGETDDLDKNPVAHVCSELVVTLGLCGALAEPLSLYPVLALNRTPSRASAGE